MFTESFFESRKVICLLTWAFLLFPVFLWPSSAEAADMALGSKTRNSDGSTSSATDTFTITGSSSQMIEWEANYFGSGPPEGDDFYLHKVPVSPNPPNFTEVPLKL